MPYRIDSGVEAEEATDLQAMLDRVLPKPELQ
jgi:hypothetical protein